MHSQPQTTSTEEPATDSSLALTPELARTLYLTNIGPRGWAHLGGPVKTLYRQGYLQDRGGRRPFQLSTKGQSYLTALEQLGGDYPPPDPGLTVDDTALTDIEQYFDNEPA